MIIKLQDLQKICEILIKNGKHSNFDILNIDVDYYRTIASTDKENFTKDNPSIVIGSLQDDVDELNKILTEENASTPLDFERLGNVFIAVGEAIAKSNKPWTL